MSKDIKTERRWLRSVIAASAEPLPAFPWVRGQRKRPAALEDAAQPHKVTARKTHQVSPFAPPGAIAAR